MQKTRLFDFGLIFGLSFLGFCPALGQNTIEVNNLIKTGEIIHGELNANSPKIDTTDLSYSLYKIELRPRELLEISQKFALEMNDKIIANIEIGEIKGNEICNLCNTNFLWDNEKQVARFVSEKNQVVSIRIQNTSKNIFGKYSFEANIIPIKPNITTPIKFGQTIKGAIELGDNVGKYGNNFDRYAINLSKGQKIAIDATSDNIDTILQIKGPKTNIQNDNGGIGDDARLTFSAPQNGRYLIDVLTNDYSANGAYQISISPPTLPTIIKPISIKNDFIHYDTLSPKDLTAPTERELEFEEIDYKAAKFYKLNLAKDRKYWIAANSKDFDILAELGSIQNGKFVPTYRDDDGGRDSNSLILAWPPHFDDVLRITRTQLPKKRAKSGSFEIFVREAKSAPAPTEIQTINLGERKIDILKDGGPRGGQDRLYKVFKIKLKNGERILTSVKADIDTLLEIGKGNAENYEMLVTNDDRQNSINPLLRFRAPNDGEYLIFVISPELMVDGKFELTIDGSTQSPPIEPIDIKFDMAISGKLTPDSTTWGAADIPFQLYTINANAGEKFTITQNSKDFDSQVGIRHIDDEKYISNDDFSKDIPNSRIEFTAKKTGQYIIRASAFYANQYGDYEIKITKN